MTSNALRSRGSATCATTVLTAATIISAGLVPASGLAGQAPDALTLGEAVQIALTRSPALLQAEAQYAREAAAGWEAWDRLVPSLSFGTGLSQSSALQRTASDPITGGIVQLPDSLVAIRESFGTSASLNANWTLFDGGRNLQAFRRTRVDVRAAEMGLDAARARIAASITLAYLDVLEAEGRERALRAEVDRAATLERTAAARFRAGAVPEIDALQARLTASDAEMNLLDAEAAAWAARLALFEYLGGPADRPLAEPDLSTLPRPEELRVRAVDQSPEIGILEARLEAAERTAALQRWWFLPSLSVGASWSRSEFGQTREGITLSPRNEGTSYRISLSWNPLQRPGGIVADRERAAAGLVVARAELEIRRATLVRGVETAIDRLERARALAERSEVNLQLAERQLEQAEARYRLGAAPLVEQLGAQALQAEATRQAIVARYAGLRALAELERASGARFLTGG